MDQVVPWKSLLGLIEPVIRKRVAAGIRTRWRRCCGASDAELVCLERPGDGGGALRDHADACLRGLSLTKTIPDETTILNFRHLLEKYELAPEILSRVNAFLTRKGLMLKRGSIVDATIIAAPSSTKNIEGERDPEMHQTKKATSGTSG